MITRKTTTIACIGILIIAWLAVFLTQVKAETTDEQKQALIGEWRGVWPGVHGDSLTLIIHEIDDAKAKARCTYIVNRRRSGKSKHEVLADFFPGPNPKLEFKARGNDFKCVLLNNVLEISFVGSVRGVPMSNATKMGKYPKK
jgi:hypothetical protein